MSILNEHPRSADSPVELSGQQRILHGLVTDKDEGLGKMYLGALFVFEQKSNPDYLALAAHGIRELIEKLPRIVGVVAQKPDVSSKCQQLSQKWDKHALKSNCFDQSSFTGEIDQRLNRFLTAALDFFDWFRQRPSRRDERTDTIRALDIGTLAMPSKLEKLRTDELAVYANYFTGVSHHNNQYASDEDFSAHLNRFELFVLDFLSPRTFEDHSALDILIKAGENDAK